ncbi:hypothetical protein A2673_02765 [Candidatus Kaiserbacteria bacterium RIFCSPHIGHO2_01_FULL_50_13]|uniref:Uncharacterized protein n=1 Tax=Candidatus Kaiserbacteria bacterium RIFCSPLOWO2_01_FULL_50_24 TaxID=1798507 RepID=A0A1F6ER79_9BACT|nr:MAG: hypothetical protein A2673_02765 [Candidatus Kaiserbacteria bacterium RIFCSPHIGHO2_01_FULL_50_13]OGG76148.1 MAG: hypothetical protein A3A34_01500 [Candidatus Kaiserbacteria bacterium RIFCSPLOWO2_01_FULL_50_24]OGG81175.1 MAG: hypothetical protein A3H74_01840 [Candidatus Kaiserbacteria bacterium RIFCSPLOWO2_02_FULL_51_13]
MLRTILIVFVIFMALAFVTMWILSGSFGRITDRASGFTNFFGLPLGESAGSIPIFELPWRVSVPQGPPVEEQIAEWERSRPIEEQITNIEEEYRAIEQEVRSLETQ